MDNLESIPKLLASFRSRTLSPVEVLRQTIARIDAINPRINALTTLCLDRANEEARLSEDRYMRREALPLDGLPFAAKDLLDTEGVRTTYGSALFRDHIPTADAEAVARLRRAGAILVGKSATHEFGWGITTSSALHGPTHNPWDTSRVPGGSSGGSAAALAAGLVPLALGSDTGGSIRIPSAFCGTAGLKPSRGRVPTDGAFALASSLDHVGPMTRSAADLPLALAVLDGTYRPGRTASAPDPALLRGLRVLVVEDLHTVPLAPDHHSVFTEACNLLAGHGAEIIERAWPGPTRPDPYGILAPTLNAEARLRHQTSLGLYPGRAAEYSPDVRRRIELAAQYRLREYVEAAQRRAEFVAAFGGLLSDADVLLTPVSAVGPVAIGTDTVFHEGQRMDIRNAVMGYIAPQSLSGLPAAVIRAGFDSQRMPVGAQLTVQFGRDARLLQLSAVFELVLGGASPGWPDIVGSGLPNDR
ncbi:amidase [Bradyrhizobium sp. Pear77]|uniref:amidase n=1 Tax=Bradyrhizobium altum TaxID=1571202 RepID=UPI001E3F143F|nr:amidase [Bradyrhizobium altum]MCC8957671.1 amidase [Bradyrhizobium altum]